MLTVVRGNAPAVPVSKRPARRPAPLRTGKLVTTWLATQFETEGALTGTPWPTHAPATIQLRAQSGRGRRGNGEGK